MENLQFQKVEFPDTRPKCVQCQSPIERTYFHFGGQTICPACAERARAGQQRPPHGLLMRGFLYGLGAAAACAVGYGIFTYVTNMEVALLAIGVGYVVGTAVRKGSRGLGGRRCQIMAVVLTYFAITMSYFPLIVKGGRESANKTAAKNPAATSGVGGTSNSPEAPKTPPVKNVSLLQFVAAIAVLAGISLAGPFLEIFSGFTGIISLLIVFFGLQQAWKQTARDGRLLMGPYDLEEGTGVA